MEIKRIADHNGTAKWSAKAIQERYVEYASKLKVSPLFDLTPETSGFWDVHIIYPVMDKVIEGIVQGDKA
ncbi:MAG TPA: hypothetical protein VF719_12010, partial [Abditibacteriaceae bacterium]